VVKIYNSFYYYSTKKTLVEVIFGHKPNFTYGLLNVEYSSKKVAEFFNSEEKNAKKHIAYIEILCFKVTNTLYVTEKRMKKANRS
jgi:hypothetical protein